MKTCCIAWRKIMPAAGFCYMLLLLSGLATVAQGQVVAEAGMQVLTRGPIHEAFAEASMSGAMAGAVIMKAPYGSISELPPELRPEGDNVAWIPGYWSWDDDYDDFIWVSGVWRDIPPNRQWIPGYWGDAGGGYQWTSGFWGDIAQTEVEYLPPPPTSLEAGPSSPAPQPDTLWSPGSWIWQQTRYDWQPGYWVAQQPDWVWAPAHYTWTPRGYVFVPGYWDHDIIHRGVMFAPVYYEQPVYTRPDYSYSPSIMIDLAVIISSLFVRPSSNHYYYGDYYDARYEERGIYPWHSEHVLRYGNDPIYAHYRSAQLRHDPDWDSHMDEQYRHRRDHIDARPPQTLALQINLFNNQKTDSDKRFAIGRSLGDAAKSESLSRHFTSVNQDDRKEFATRGRAVRELQSERARLERSPEADGKSREPHETGQPVRMRFPESPVAARPTRNGGDAKSPPPMPVASVPVPRAVEGRERDKKPERTDEHSEPAVTPERPQGDAIGHSERTETWAAPSDEKPHRVEASPPARAPQEAERRDRDEQPERSKVQPGHAATPERSKSDGRGHSESKETRSSPTSNPEVKSQHPESETRAPRSDSHERQGKQEKTPGTEDKKDKEDKQHGKG